MHFLLERRFCITARNSCTSNKYSSKYHQRLLLPCIPTAAAREPLLTHQRFCPDYVQYVVALGTSKATYRCSHSLHRTAALLAVCPDSTLSFQDRNCILGWGRPGAGWEHKQREKRFKKQKRPRAWMPVCFCTLHLSRIF